MKTTLSTTRSDAGFTIVEVMLAAVLAMILMFGALYSTGQSYEVAREGDRRIHTHIFGRDAMDRLLKDCRYSSELAITGDKATGWTIDVTTTGTLDPGPITYKWDPQTEVLTVTDGVVTNTVIEGLEGFEITTETFDPGTGPEISRVIMNWTLKDLAGLEAGAEGGAPETLRLGGTSWVQRSAPFN